MTFLKKIANSIKQKFYPPRCIFCRKVLEDGTKLCVCIDCAKNTERIPSQHCPVCGRSTKLGNILCYRCSVHTPFYRNHRSVYYYKDNVRKSLWYYKLRGKKQYGETMSMIMSGYVPFDATIDLITFVPMTKKTLKKRGYNQSEILAKGISSLVNIPLGEAVLKIRETKRQKNLKYAQRQRNLNGAFKATDTAQGKSILLIDDIFTTGATLNTVSKALKKGGAKEVYCLTFAMTADKDFKGR